MVTRDTGRPAPHELYQQAHSECRDQGEDAIGALMRQHGHIIDRSPGDDSPLFACGYDPRRRRR